MLERKTVVLTGFGPFPGMVQNATAVLVPRLTTAARARFVKHDIISEVLPTEWDAAPEALTRLLNGCQSVVALHFGVCDHAGGFQIELIGRNLRGEKRDAAGKLPATEHIAEEDPDLLASTLPVETILARLTKLNLPCSASTNAGTYLCNALLYHSLNAARARSRPFAAGFIHVPSSLIGHGENSQDPHPNCPLDWDGAVIGGLEIIAATLEMDHAKRAVV